SCRVMGFEMVDSGWAVVVSCPDMINVRIFPDDVLCIDGNSDHCTEGTMLLLSVVSNASRNIRHQHTPIAIGVISGHEDRLSVSMFIHQVMNLRGGDFGTLLWRCDGHEGLRAGIVIGCTSRVIEPHSLGGELKTDD